MPTETVSCDELPVHRVLGGKHCGCRWSVDPRLHIVADVDLKSESVDGCGLKI